ncbi:hypothetical protein I2I11_02430 [Pontibacter sp. 172403-2]|uniref:hypothetical protein n=1 Tax=Pontibacter rufus TaxID=2791028 RepID=UPI0018AFB818|nr:hypothetical protein [Pontibacter sp. 172403-2]MBF9252140.1 hypothetical protein [Pontibacter sp. 172403-2]
MFTSISWTNYIVVIILLLAIYYILIGICFYSRDFQQFLTVRRKGKIRSSGDEIVDDIPLNNPDDPFKQIESDLSFSDSSFAQTSDDTFEDIERLILRLKEAIADAGTKQYIKQEFFLLLQLILKEYPHLKDSPFQSTINELIISECGKYGSIAISEEEVVMLWNTVV